MISFTNLFTRLGHIVKYGDDINVARGTTFPAAAQTVSNSVANAAVEIVAAVQPLLDSVAQVQSGSAQGLTGVREAASNLLQTTINDDTPLAELNDLNALLVLIDQMTANSQSVAISTVGVTTVAANTNVGDAVVIASRKRADGSDAQNLLAETITARVTSVTTPATAGLSLYSSPALLERLDQAWPAGSGLNGKGISLLDASGIQYIPNGSFDQSTVTANVPDGWTVGVGTPGTQINMSVYEVQTITISGSSSAGTYQIEWQNPLGNVLATSPLNFDAAGSLVQAALRLLPGLETVDVASTGTSPAFTHTITFTGQGGNLHQVTIANNSTGLTITPGTTTNGTSHVLSGRALFFAGDNTTQTAIYVPVTLQPLTQYAFNVFLQVDVVAAAGVVAFELVDGIGGSVTNDEAGSGNTFSVGHASLTTFAQAFNAFFRTPTLMPPQLYLRIRLSTALSTGSNLYLDQACLGDVTILYNGGPQVAAFSGGVDVTIGGASVPADYWTITVTNDRAGLWQEWFNRIFAMADKGLLLPSNVSPTISSALIA